MSIFSLPNNKIQVFPRAKSPAPQNMKKKNSRNPSRLGREDLLQRNIFSEKLKKTYKLQKKNFYFFDNLNNFAFSSPKEAQHEALPQIRGQRQISRRRPLYQSPLYTIEEPEEYEESSKAGKGSNQTPDPHHRYRSII